MDTLSKDLSCWSKKCFLFSTYNFFNPFIPGGLFHPYKLDESICHLRGCLLFFFFFFFFHFYLFKIEIPACNKCRPWSDAAASNRGVHCLRQCHNYGTLGIKGLIMVGLFASVLIRQKTIPLLRVSFYNNYKNNNYNNNFILRRKKYLAPVSV